MTTKKVIVACAATAAAAALVVPALSSGHTTISPTQPQGPLLTAQRTSYVVRSPNETPSQSTFKIVMFVPAQVQQGISVLHSSNWAVHIKKAKTSKKDEDGNPVYAVSAVSWTAKRASDEVAPFEYGEWPVRFQNPAAAAKMCFGFLQYYRNEDGSRKKPDIVRWTGPADSEHPSSCIQIVNSAPAAS